MFETPRRPLLVVTCVIAAMSGGTTSADVQNWPFDLATAGEDVTYDSPTPTDPAALRYAATTQIDLLEVTVDVLIFNDLVIDATDLVDLDALTGVRLIDGPAPVGIFDEQILYPDPPEDPAVAGDVTMTLDGDGFGHLSIENVKLGSTQLNVPPFGIQTVTIEAIRVVGSIIITPIPDGDVNFDGCVDLDDLLDVIANWGSFCEEPTCPSVLCFGHADDDCTVGLSDLLAVIGNWGTGCE